MTKINAPHKSTLIISKKSKIFAQGFVDKMSADGNKFIKSAQYMIERYGDHAVKEVDLRIAELHEQGQIEAHEFWIEIRKAVIFLNEPSNNQDKH